MYARLNYESSLIQTCYTYRVCTLPGQAGGGTENLSGVTSHELRGNRGLGRCEKISLSLRSCLSACLLVCLFVSDALKWPVSRTSQPLPLSLRMARTAQLGPAPRGEGEGRKTGFPPFLHSLFSLLVE